jgi:hypothetical protein
VYKCDCRPQGRGMPTPRSYTTTSAASGAAGITKVLLSSVKMPAIFMFEFRYQTLESHVHSVHLNFTVRTGVAC